MEFTREELAEDIERAVAFISGFSFDPEDYSDEELQELHDILTRCANELADTAA